MKRLKIRHCRDSSVLPHGAWDLWAIETHDPHAEPLFLGYGTWEGCYSMALDLMDMERNLGQFQFAGFQCPAPF